jgi:uncharacterized protein (DUF697 family)
MSQPQDSESELTQSGAAPSAETPDNSDPSTSTPDVTDKSLVAQPATQPEKKEFWESATDLATGLGEAVGKTVRQTGKAALDTASGVGQVIGATANHTGKTVLDTTTGIGKAITHTTAQTSKAALEKAIDLGEAIGSTATHTSKALVGMTTSTGTFAIQHIQQLLNHATQGTGQAIDFVGNNPIVKRALGALKLDWLVSATDRVDVVKATAAVRELQQEHPDESPSQIAHRIMVQKAIYAGGSGLVSSLVPGQAIALFAVDLAATTALQAEMVYQIAAAYGLDLEDPARKGEVLAIFGLALGGGRAIKAGLAFVRSVPVAGALIGAGANATMLYALGYAACRFYEAKLNPDVVETSTEALEAIQQNSERYLAVATAQETITDQVLAHMILASHPEKSWDDILPNLQSLNFAPASLEAIAKNIQSPQPLGALLDQLNRDFAAPLLARCYRIAQLDHEISAEEAKILQAIQEKFDLNPDAIAATANLSLSE